MRLMQALLDDESRTEALGWVEQLERLGSARVLICGPSAIAPVLAIVLPIQCVVMLAVLL